MVSGELSLSLSISLHQLWFGSNESGHGTQSVMLLCHLRVSLGLHWMGLFLHLSLIFPLLASSGGWSKHCGEITPRTSWFYSPSSFADQSLTAHFSSASRASGSGSPTNHCRGSSLSIAPSLPNHPASVTPLGLPDQDHRSIGADEAAMSRHRAQTRTPTRKRGLRTEERDSAQNRWIGKKERRQERNARNARKERKTQRVDEAATSTRTPMMKTALHTEQREEMKERKWIEGRERETEREVNKSATTKEWGSNVAFSLRKRGLIEKRKKRKAEQRKERKGKKGTRHDMTKISIRSTAGERRLAKLPTHTSQCFRHIWLLLHAFIFNDLPQYSSCHWVTYCFSLFTYREECSLSCIGIFFIRDELRELRKHIKLLQGCNLQTWEDNETHERNEKASPTKSEKMHIDRRKTIRGERKGRQIKWRSPELNPQEHLCVVRLNLSSCPLWHCLHRQLASFSVWVNRYCTLDPLLLSLHHFAPFSFSFWLDCTSKRVENEPLMTPASPNAAPFRMA